MGCGCQKVNRSVQFIYTAPTGKQTVYPSQVQAQAAVIRSGGTWVEVPR